MSASSFNKIFSSRLRHYLSINNMTQLELSRKLGVGTTSVSNWCKGIKTPRMDKVDAMCVIFNCRRRDLMEQPDGQEDFDLKQNGFRPLSPDEAELLEDYNGLNEYGKNEARKRVNELAEIDRYKKGTSPNSEVMAG